MAHTCNHKKDTGHGLDCVGSMAIWESGFDAMLQRGRVPRAGSIHNKDTENGKVSQRDKLFHIPQYASARAGKKDSVKVGDLGRGCENPKRILSGQGILSRGH